MPNELNTLIQNIHVLLFLPFPSIGIVKVWVMPGFSSAG